MSLDTADNWNCQGLRHEPGTSLTAQTGDVADRYEAFRAEPALAPLSPPRATVRDQIALNGAALLWNVKAHTVHLARTRRARRTVMARESAALL